MTSPPHDASVHSQPWPSRRLALLGCAAAGFVVFQFFGNGGRGYIDTASLFWWWGFQWFNPGSETEHGPLILGLAGWLFWRNLRSPKFSFPAEGRGRDGVPFVAMGGALLLHALGYAVEQARFSIVALLVFTWGLLRLAGGRRWGWAAVFPVAFLLFAIPLNALDSVGFHLRLWVIDATHALAGLAGIDVIRNGTQLFSPDGSYQYDVAAACSGVRSLMALMALSLLIAYLNLRSNLRRAAIFLLCFPLTYLGNIVRIGAIVVAGETLGQNAGLWVHDWAGFLVFGVVLGGVLAAVALWTRWRPEPAAEGPSAITDASAHAPPMRTGVLAVGVLAVAVAVAGFTVAMDRRPATGGAGIVLADDGLAPADLPAFIGVEWIGQRAEVTPIEREVLPSDTGFARRNYVSTRNRQDQVFLSIVLSGRDRTSIHRPELCLVGQGWSIEGRTTHTFTHPAGGTVPATVLRIVRETVDARGERRRIPAAFAYWFVGEGAIEPTHAGRLWRTALNRLRGRNDRWAYVVAQTLSFDGEAEALARLQVVLNGSLSSFLPAGE